MYERSPIAHVAKVRAPVLLSIGRADLRVPPSQGFEYYHALRSENVINKGFSTDITFLKHEVL